MNCIKNEHIKNSMAHWRWHAWLIGGVGVAHWWRWRGSLVEMAWLIGGYGMAH